MNDNPIAPQATADATFLLLRRPPKALIRNPMSGSAGISSSIGTSPLQLGERVGVQRLAVPEQADDDREADRRFRRGDGHHEEDDDLAVRGAVHAAERDEREIDRVQHDLDRQQDRDEVPAHEHACRADAEQHGREDQVVLDGSRHRCAPSLRASTTAPTIATRIRIDVTSNANAYSVKSIRPIAATLVTEPMPKRPVSPAVVSAHTSSIRRATASSPPSRIGPGRSSGCVRSSNPVSSCGAFSSITTKRNSTMIAPAYTMIWITATNGASSRTYRPESAPNDAISSSTL